VSRKEGESLQHEIQKLVGIIQKKEAEIEEKHEKFKAQLIEAHQKSLELSDELNDMQLKAQQASEANEKIEDLTKENKMLKELVDELDDKLDKKDQEYQRKTVDWESNLDRLKNVMEQLKQ